MCTTPSNHPTVTEAENNDDKVVWFAMSAPYRRELKAKFYLNGKNIECFVPMRHEVIETKSGIKKRELVPAIHNLIFVHTSKNIIKQLKQGVDFLQFRTFPQNGKNVPITVPEKQMQQFIAVTESHNEELIYLRPDELQAPKGQRVRIHGGTFDGIEGVLVKIQGKRRRRVVVEIEGVAGIVLAEISPDLIEILPQKNDRQ